MNIVLASSNKGKLAEFQQLLAPLNMDVHPQSKFGTPDIEETGLTFVENAILKARNACKHSGLPAIADDSGLEVDALEGQPGIYSARYSGKGATDESNNALLLEKLNGVPTQKRSARFQCILVFMRHEADPTPLICQGTWEGRILESPQGKNGFGYDPLFWVKYHLCSSAQLTSEQKNSLSHRGQALRLLMEKLPHIYQ
jgi:XTP/dITP diphosphohydrolase